MRNGWVKIACCVPPVQVADVAFNTEQTVLFAAEAAKKGAKIAVFPELGLTAYTCGDLFLQRQLTDAAQAALLSVAAKTAKLDLLLFVGLPFSVGSRLYDVAAAIYGGEILALIPKVHLSDCGGLSEKRYFASGEDVPFDTVLLGGEDIPFGTDLLLTHRKLPELRVAAELGGDAWSPDAPSARHALAGASVIVNLAASDELVTKDDYRRTMLRAQSARLICAYAYCGAGCGESTQDAVFTGHSLIYENGQLLAERNELTANDAPILLTEVDVHSLDSERRKTGFSGGLIYSAIPFGIRLTETELTRPVSRTPFVPEDAEECAARCEKIFGLQALALKKRMEHTHAKCAVVGISGGLDSTLALLVSVRAADLLNRPHSDVLAVTMPCYGTTGRTRSNAEKMAEALGCTLKIVPIGAAVAQHFADIGHDPAVTDTTYENAQARERTQVLMDLAGEYGGFVVGTGDLSELALGWATYNGDHMSMYGVNASVPKTLLRSLVSHIADRAEPELAEVLRDVVATPVSPELLPPKDGAIAQVTEELVGPYELHDFFLYYAIRRGFEPKKLERLAQYAFAGAYDNETLHKWLVNFYRRFFTQQFKRSCLPDGPKLGTLSLSPRGDWQMPSDAVANTWLDALKA